MEVPLEIAFHNLSVSPAIEAAIRGQAAKLERFAPDIVSCRVSVEEPHRRHRKGNLFAVHVDIRVSGGEAVASRDAGAKHEHEDIHRAVRDAFRAARRQLQDRVRVRRGDVKPHEAAPHGTIAALDMERHCGRIAASDGREIYFHANSVVNEAFEDLAEGTEVWFSEEAGDEGPQASTVHVLGKHHIVD